MTVAKVRKTKAATHHRANRGRMNFHHFFRGTPAMARQETVMPLAGVMQLVNASPNWKARTAVWRVIPTRSASGAMMGMVMAA